MRASANHTVEDLINDQYRRVESMDSSIQSAESETICTENETLEDTKENMSDCSDHSNESTKREQTSLCSTSEHLVGSKKGGRGASTNDGKSGKLSHVDRLMGKRDDESIHDVSILGLDESINTEEDRHDGQSRSVESFQTKYTNTNMKTADSERKPSYFQWLLSLNTCNGAGYDEHRDDEIDCEDRKAPLSPSVGRSMDEDTEQDRTEVRHSAAEHESGDNESIGDGLSIGAGSPAVDDDETCNDEESALNSVDERAEGSNRHMLTRRQKEEGRIDGSMDDTEQDRTEVRHSAAKHQSDDNESIGDGLSSIGAGSPAVDDDETWNDEKSESNNVDERVEEGSICHKSMRDVSILGLDESINTEEDRHDGQSRSVESFQTKYTNTNMKTTDSERKPSYFQWLLSLNTCNGAGYDEHRDDEIDCEDRKALLSPSVGRSMDEDTEQDRTEVRHSAAKHESGDNESIGDGLSSIGAGSPAVDDDENRVDERVEEGSICHKSMHDESILELDESINTEEDRHDGQSRSVESFQTKYTNTNMKTADSERKPSYFQWLLSLNTCNGAGYDEHRDDEIDCEDRKAPLSPSVGRSMDEDTEQDRTEVRHSAAEHESGDNESIGDGLSSIGAGSPAVDDDETCNDEESTLISVEERAEGSNRHMLTRRQKEEGRIDGSMDEDKQSIDEERVSVYADELSVDGGKSQLTRRARRKRPNVIKKLFRRTRKNREKQPFVEEDIDEDEQSFDEGKENISINKDKQSADDHYISRSLSEGNETKKDQYSRTLNQSVDAKKSTETDELEMKMIVLKQNDSKLQKKAVKKEVTVKSIRNGTINQYVVKKKPSMLYQLSSIRPLLVDQKSAIAGRMRTTSCTPRYRVQSPRNGSVFQRIKPRPVLRDATHPKSILRPRQTQTTEITSRPPIVDRQSF